MQSILIKKVYRFIWEKDSARHATITFIFNRDGKWEFDGCDYTCLAMPYDIDDWDFLREVSGEILRLNNEMEKI